jgi:hypothetical protein
MNWQEKKKKYCLLCAKDVDEVIDLSADRYSHVRERVKKDNPEWKGENGACGRCLALYEKR